MFFNQKCIIKKEAHRRTQKSSDCYFQKFVLDEERRVNELKSHGKVINPEDVNTSICQELKEYKKQDVLEHKRRQKLRNDSHELRLLQTQLQRALVSKQLTEQNCSLRKQRELEMDRKREEDALWTNECEKSRKAVLEQEQKERQKKATFRVVLQGQIHEMQDKRKKEFENVLMDRDEIQKTLTHIQAEEQAEKEVAQRFRDRCRQEMEDCLRNREIQRQLEKEQNVDDSERLMAYQSERDELKKRMETEKKMLLAEKMALSERIGNELANINKEKKKREDLLLSLLVEERKAKEDEKYRLNMDRQVKERTQLRIELENYRREVTIQKERQFQEEERQMREEHMRQMAERDKLDQLSDEKRRRKIMEHNKVLKEMIELRRRQRAEEIAERIGDFEKSLNNEKERDQCIEDERIRMLQSTPGELLRYLPPGVLRPSDRAFLSLPEQKE